MRDPKIFYTRDLGKYEVGEIMIYDGPGDCSQSRQETTIDRAIDHFGSQGYKMASFEEIAKARIEGGIDAPVTRNGGMTKEAVIYLPEKKEIIVTKNSPIIANAKWVVNWDAEHGMGSGPRELAKKNLEDFLRGSIELDPESIPSVVLPPPYEGCYHNPPTEAIPTSDFDNHDLTHYLLGKTAEKYGQFLKQNGFDHARITQLYNGGAAASGVKQIGFNAIQNDAGISLDSCVIHDPTVFFIR